MTPPEIPRPMLTREVLITRINSSLAWLEGYLKLNAQGNLNTAAVLAEDLCIRLLNLVYGHRLKNANADQLNAPAVDLVLAGHVDGPRHAYQVTINDTPQKISDTHKRLAGHPEIAERFDEVIIFFLVRKAPRTPKPSSSFTPCTQPSVRCLDLAGLAEDIRALPLDRIGVIADALDEETSRRDSAPQLTVPPSATAQPPWSFLQFFSSFWTDLAKALACLAAVIIAWQKIPALLGVQPGSSTGLVAIGIAAVPLLCYLFLDALPRWREARYRARAPVAKDTDENYFKTWPRPAPADGQPVTFSRPDQAEQTVLDWIERAASPLLHLTGASGTGKSSLLDAFVIPHLRRRDPAWHVIKLRSFDDPLSALAAALPGVWKKPPADLPEALSDRLIRALAYLQERNRRLLLVFDQFEELFILHPLPAGPPPDDSHAPLVQRVGELLTAVTLTAPIPGLTVLLSYRADHRSDIDSLRLPARNEDHEPAIRTSFEVQPFNFAAARAYLTGCPGLTIPPARLQQALEEAAAIDENSQRVRPIVLNLLGRALQDLAENPRRSSRRGSLLHDYIRTHAFDPREERLPRLILPRLLSEKGTVAPASADAIATAAGQNDKATLTVPAVTNFLSRLRAPGLVRQIGTGPRPQWEIAHDFIARLIHIVLGGTAMAIWRKARPWLAPGLIASLLLAGSVVVPAYREREALRILGEAGFTWQGDKREAAALNHLRYNSDFPDVFPEPPRLDKIVSALKVLSCESLDLRLCTSLTNLDSLAGLNSLKTLDLGGCTITNLGALKGLTSLQSLDLSHCDALASVNGLQGLTSLQTIYLSHCDALASVNGLQGLTSLQTIYLSHCDALARVDGLQGLTLLQSLDLSHCAALASVDGLQGLTSLQSLDLSHCAALVSVGALKGLTSLQSLDLSHCDALASVDGLQGLTSLQSLDLSDCAALASVGALKGLTSLQSLNLSHCAALASVDGLQILTSLQTIYLSHCAALASVDGLQGLTSLQRLDLSNCDALASVDGLQGLTSLQSLNLSHCDALASVDGLQGITSLQSLDLFKCDALASVDGLKGLTSLQRLDLSNCDALASVDSLQELKSLQWLYLSGCPKVPEGKVTALQAALPDCRIES
jgi:Leucine-rich repeat (LRR) protein